MGLHELLPSVDRPRVVGRTVRDVVEGVPDRREEGLAQLPLRVGDDDAGCVAVEAGVVREGGGDVAGLVAQFGVGPWARDHDEGAEVGEFGGHRSVVEGVVVRLSLGEVLPHAVHDRVVGVL